MSSPEPSPASSTCASPVVSRPSSPKPCRPTLSSMLRAMQGSGEDDEDETLEEIAALAREAAAREERRRSLQARIDVNARKGFTHGIRVGEIEGVEHGAQHRRYRRSEAKHVSKAVASEDGVGPHPRTRGLVGGCVCCGATVSCSLKHVILAECNSGKVDLTSYLENLVQAVRGIEKLVPQVKLGRDTPIGQWCMCRTILRTALVAVEQRGRGEAVGEDGWIAVRRVIAGLLPECRAVLEAEEREKRQAETVLAKAIVELQEVVISMLRTYREGTREVRAQKREQLDAWWVEHRRRTALHAKVLNGLKGWVAKSRSRRKRLCEAIDSATERASVSAREEQRRKVARQGGPCAHTRAGGLHLIGASPSECGKRKGDGRWEAGDRCHKAALLGRSPVDSSGGGDCGGDGGVPCVTILPHPPLPPPPSPSTPPPPPPAGGRVTRRQVVTSRWHPYALEQFSSAVRRSRDDGVT